MNMTPSARPDDTSSTNPTPSSTARERALVLAGAGASGNAWEIGIIAGLSDAGVNLTDADLIIGTSAGSTVAAQITSDTSPARLYADIVAEASQPRAGVAGPERGRGGASLAATYLKWSDDIIDSAQDAADMRRRMGAAALEIEATGGSGTSAWRDVVAARLSSHDWPHQRVLITAVDASTGEPVLLDRDSGLDLVDAVAASTSNGFKGPYRAGGTSYINGGYRRNENADLAAGHRRVLVLSPFGGRTRHPLHWGMHLAAQVDELQAGGSRVETIVPDSDSEHLFGANAMDLSLRAPAARAGYVQGQGLAVRLAEFWRA